MKKKSIALLLAIAIVVVGVVAGTLAWLTDKTAPVTNTFTTSDINVKLEENTGNSYKMIPGYTITKDPKAWVEAGSEDCYLFVKLEWANNTFGTGSAAGNYLSYEIADGWTELTAGSGVYYRTVTSAEMGEAHKFSVLKDDSVTVNGNITKEMMTALTEATYPTLKVTAYASQLHKNSTETFTAAEAWANIK